MRHVTLAVGAIFLAAGLAGCLPPESPASTGAPAAPAPPVRVVAPPRAPSVAPTSDPILRIETGRQHTGAIRRLAVDAAGRLLLTASLDKTVRVWDLQTGDLRRVLRPPIAPGNEGKLYAVAISPDGSLAAAGGWARMGDNDIYFFLPETGEMVARIGGLPDVINDLAWSPDGTRVAAILGQGGLRVFGIADLAEIARDTDYGAPGYQVLFTPDGGLITTCDDGQLRRYDAAMARTARVSTTGGAHPFGASLTPDGLSLAVGYDDTATVEFFDAETLEPLGTADTSAYTAGNLSTVTFTGDGRHLLAGGQLFDAGRYPILTWPIAPPTPVGAPALSFPLALDTVLDLAPYFGSAVLFASSDPMWGILSPDTPDQIYTVGPATADYRALGQGFALSAGADTVAFAYGLRGADPATFSLADRSLASGAALPGLAAPRLAAPGLELVGAVGTAEPRLNGRPLAMQAGELSRSAAIAPDGATVAIGGSWSLRLFGADARQRWVVDAPGTAWAVNIPPNGRTVVAAFGDGTIRWFRHADGAELLAFFPHADRQRWVLWTPTGYYDGSPGAEELIGWHLNNGLDRAADFFPASRFRDRFYRPDIIDRVLTELDEAEAVRLANEARGTRPRVAEVANALPPVVTVTAPLDGAAVAEPTVTIAYSLRTADDAPVTRVWALVDGRPAETARALGAVQRESLAPATTLTVPIPPRDCEISLLAENRHGVSVPFNLRVRWAGQPPAEVVTDELKPKLYAFVVGVSDYQSDAIDDLAFAAKDARDFAGAVSALRGGLYRDVEIRLLTDAEATRDEVVDGLDWLVKSTTGRDVAMLFLAGHGMNDTNNIYYYLPHNGDPDRLLRTGVRTADVRDTLSSIAGKALFFIDSCHAGNALGAGVRTRSLDVNGLVNELTSAENGAVVFSASTGRQVSMESTGWQNGAFTKAVVEGLNGLAARNGKITVATMDFYISERVKELTAGRQTPVVRKPDTVPDFPIAIAP